MSFSERMEYWLGDIVDIIGGGTPKTSNSGYWNGPIPWLSVVDFAGENKKVYTTEKTITEKGLRESSTKILKQGQLIISARGTVGEVAMLGKDMAFNQSCYGLNAKPQTTNDYLYYLLKHNLEEIKRRTHGAVFDTITRETFNHIRVSLPSLPRQQHVAAILSSLDDKIELNRQTNQTLESIAQAIFKEWFLNFKFPGATGKMQDSKLGEIPKGWKTAKLGDILEVKGGSTPSTKVPEYWDGPFNWATPKDLSNLQSPVLLKTEKKITEIGIKQISSGVLPKDTLLLSSRAPIGYLAISAIPVSINQGFIAINGGELSNLFLLFWLKQNMDSVVSRANGSTFLEISKSNFKEIEIVIPSKTLHASFVKVVSPLFDQMKNNEQQIQTLVQLRDTLLPKLMRGEIPIPEV